MMHNDSPRSPARPPHPLALALIERLRDRPGAAVLEIGAGSGRNTRALEAAGFRVLAPPPKEPCAAGLSTHELLHGTPATLTPALAAVARGLETHAPLFATFGSIRDARYGTGEEREPHVYAPRDGDEAGVSHAYFDEARLRTMLERHFTIEAMHEVEVDAIAGTWAHQRAPLYGAVHWFVIAQAR